MSDKLIITHYNKHIISLLYNNSELVQIQADNDDCESILGNIYIGKVKNIVKNIEAAFIEIENNIMCYFSLKESKKPIFLNPKKNNNVNIGDELLVQVSKDAINTKAAVVTDCLNFTGKYAVLTHGKTSLSVSSKIRDNETRTDFVNMLKKYENDNYGFIIRTDAVNVPVELVENEISQLINEYNDLLKKAPNIRCFSNIKPAPKPYLSNIRDTYTNSLEKIITDDEKIYNNIKLYLTNFGFDADNKIELYNDTNLKLSTLYNIEKNVNNALKKNVWLKSGGSIVIEVTEALVAIDVNTKKAIESKTSSEKTFLKTNLEAGKEIAKQLRLRNLGGIIIVDFIDLKKKEDRDYLLKEFSKELSKDPVKTTLVDMTKLNLVEITRKKVRKPLYQQFQEDI